MAIDKIKSFFSDPGLSDQDFQRNLESFDHFDIARLLHQLSREEKVKIFQYLGDDTKRQEVLYETDIESRKELIESLGHDFMAPFLEGMPQDEAADILQEHEPEVQEKILEQMEPDEAQSLKNLIQYNEETAGGLMSPEFNKVDPDEVAGDILMKFVRDNKADQGLNFYVVNNENELLGYFKLRDLLNVQPNAKASNFIREATPSVFLEDSCEKIANIMDHEHLSILPVIDSDNLIHGIVTFDDVFRGLKHTTDDDIYTMAGTAKVNPFAKRTITKIAARAPWLLTTFIGGMVSALILKQFELTLAEFSVVLLFIPFVLGLAGNVGIQGATIIVRGMATGDVQKDNLKTIVFSEIKVGVLNGLLFGTGCGIILTVFSNLLPNGNSLLGLSLGLGIFLAVSMASIIGSTLPLFFVKMKIDPAISTGPMVTVINDIIGLFTYLSTTTVIFSYL